MVNTLHYTYHHEKGFIIRTHQKAGAQAKARPSQVGLLAFGLAHDFVKPEPTKARPKPGLSGQARAGTSLVNILTDPVSTVVSGLKSEETARACAPEKILLFCGKSSRV